MSEQTVNYHFIKPQPEDFVDVQDLDDNFDSIDGILKELDDAVTEAQTQIKLGSITLSADWTGEESPFSQVVTVVGATVTGNSKVDLQANDETEAQMKEDGCKKLYVVNDDGVLTAYAVGTALSAGVTVDCLVTEVATV